MMELAQTIGQPKALGLVLHSSTPAFPLLFELRKYESKISSRVIAAGHWVWEIYGPHAPAAGIRAEYF